MLILHASHHGSGPSFEEGQDMMNHTDGLEVISPDYTVISGCDCDDKVKRLAVSMMMLLHYMKNIPAVTEAFILQVKMETLYWS